MAFFIRRRIVDEVNADPDLHVINVVADKPARHVLKGLVGHSGYFSCEMGVSPGVSRGRNRGGGGGIHWPYNSCKDCRPRNKDEFERIARYIEACYAHGYKSFMRYFFVPLGAFRREHYRRAMISNGKAYKRPRPFSTCTASTSCSTSRWTPSTFCMKD